MHGEPPHDLRWEITRSVKEVANREHLLRLIERCKADPDGLAILKEAYQSCNPRWHALTRDDLHEAIKTWQAPPASQTQSVAPGTVLRVGEHAPAELRAEFMEFVKVKGGDYKLIERRKNPNDGASPRHGATGDYRRLIERCKGYVDGRSVLAEVRQFANDYYINWGGELYRALDDAMKNWRPPSEAEPKPAASVPVGHEKLEGEPLRCSVCNRGAANLGTPPGITVLQYVSSVQRCHKCGTPFCRDCARPKIEVGMWGEEVPGCPKCRVPISPSNTGCACSVCKPSKTKAAEHHSSVSKTKASLTFFISAPSSKAGLDIAADAFRKFQRLHPGAIEQVEGGQVWNPKLDLLSFTVAVTGSSITEVGTMNAELSRLIGKHQADIGERLSEELRRKDVRK
jgi:hypothetical protein